MKKLLFLFLCMVFVFALYADPNDGDTAGLIENFEAGQSCFQVPTYSGTSTGYTGPTGAGGSVGEIVDYRYNWRLDPDAAWYDEDATTGNSWRAVWTWGPDGYEGGDDDDLYFKIRMTSYNRPNARNTITGLWQFKIWDATGVGFYYYYVGEPIWVGISIREDPIGDGNIYEITQLQELIPEPDWQYMYFDFTEPGMFAESFWVDENLGNGTLTSAEPLFEGLFFTPVGGYDVALLEEIPVEIFIDDVHYGAPHTPADPPTSAGSWMLFH